MRALGATVPGLHGICVVLPANAKKPGAVGVQSSALLRSVALEKLPFEQGSATTLPVGQYPPAEHVSGTEVAKPHM